MPVEYTKPQHDLSEHRDNYIKGAQAFDVVTRELSEYKHRLDQAMLGLEAKNTEIMNLQIALTDEKNRVLNYQLERDEAVNDKAQAEARLLDIKAIIERADLPPPKQRRRKFAHLDRAIDKPNESPNGGDAVPDQTGSPAPVAEPPLVVAHE